MAIPDAILHKPGRLTAAEYDEIKKHTSIGGELLRDINKQTNSHSMQTAFEIAMYHHEHFNGGGYPERLTGDEIPISARIMALADIYDALTSTRCYRKALSHEKAKELLLDECGKQLDPRVIDAFLRQEEIWQTIRQRYVD